MGLGEERGQIEGVADVIHPETLEEGLAAGRNDVDQSGGEKGGKIMVKAVPKRNGSGGGTRANRGRGGCTTTRKAGRGRRR